MITATGNLVIVDADTHQPRVFWRGTEVTGVKSVRVADGAVTIMVEKTDADRVHDELYDNGIRVRKV